MSEAINVARRDTADRDERSRAWAHFLHLDGELLQRGNLFLLGESLLAVAYAAITAAAVSDSTAVAYLRVLTSLTLVIGAIGLFVGILWLYVQHHQWRYREYLRKRCIALLPEFERTISAADRPRLAPGALVAYLLPAMSMLMWAALLVLALSLRSL